MAPEVKETTIYDKTADIYSLGLVLYYLSNDFRLPFADVADPEERINRRMKKDAVLPEPENAFADMRKLILKACAYDPKDRYQSAGEMKKALENIQKHPYGLCPKCGKVLVKKPGQYGAFVACTGYRKGNPGFLRLPHESKKTDGTAECRKRTECIVTETFKKHIRKQIKGWKSYV